MEKYSQAVQEEGPHLSMNISQDQIDELKEIVPSVSLASEGGHFYLLINDVTLPAGCVPPITNVLLCPTTKDGYNSRLYFPVLITGCPARNWNSTNVRILGSTWFAFSWISPAGLSLKDMLLFHLNTLK